MKKDIRNLFCLSLLLIGTNCAVNYFDPHSEEMKLDGSLVGEKIKTENRKDILIPGENAQDLISEINNIKYLEKDEFETTDEYNKRIQEKVNKFNLNRGNYFIIEIDMQTKYNADSEILDVVFDRSFTFDSNYISTPCYEKEERWSKNIGNTRYDIEHTDYDICTSRKCTYYYCVSDIIKKETKTYDAQNGFGAEVTVYSSSYSNYGYMLNINPFMKFSMKVSSDEARLLKDNIKIIAMGKVEKFGRFHSYKLKEATFNSPTSIYISYDYIPIDVESICLYDSKNKKCIEDMVFYRNYWRKTSY